MASHHLARDASVGLAVGVTDVAILYPLVCLASRLESGRPLSTAVRQGQLYSGAASALKLLVPYCILVEAASDVLTLGADTPERKVMAAPLSSLVVSLGLQPLEKHMTMEQLLETKKSGLSGIVEYTRRKGVRGIMKGYWLLWSRETVYIAAVTGLNPYFAERHGAIAAFAVGFGAGMASAPLQTLNVLMKSEANVDKTLPEVMRNESLSIRRLWKGSLPRSLRTGFAGILWFEWRDFLTAKWKSPPVDM